MRTIFGLAIFVIQSAMTGCGGDCPVCDVQIHDTGPTSMPDLMPAQPRCMAATGLSGDPLTVQMGMGPAVPLCFDFPTAQAKDLSDAGFNLVFRNSHCNGWNVTTALQPNPISTGLGDKICGMMTPDIRPYVLSYKHFALSVVQTVANSSANISTSINLRISNKAELMDIGPKAGTLTNPQPVQSVFLFETSRLLAGSTAFNIYFELNVPISEQIPSWQIQSLAILGIPN